MIVKKCAFFIFVVTSLFSINCFGYYFSLHVQELEGATITNPAVATSSYGSYVYVVYVKDNNYFIEVSSKYGNPTSWPSSAKALTSDNKALNPPQIATNFNGENILIAWQNSDGNVVYALSTNFGAAWSNAIDIGAGSNVKVAMNFDGNWAYILYSSGSTLKVARLNKSTTTLTVEIDSSAASFSNTAIDTSLSGEIVYVAAKNKGSGNMIFYRSKNANKNPPSYSPILTQALPNSANPQVKTSTDGSYAYFTYLSVGGNIAITVSKNGGAFLGFLAQSALSATPKIEIDSSGKFAYVIYEDNSGNIKYYANNNYGNLDDWNLFSILQPNGSVQSGSSPDIITDYSGRYIIASLDDSATPRFYYSLDWANSFIRLTNPSTPTVSDIQAPKLAMDSDGEHTYSIWTASDSSAQLGIIRRTYFPPIPPLPPEPDPLSILPPNVTIVK